MSFEEILIQIMLWSIAGLSAFISWEFYTSKNGRLRILMIRLFAFKTFVYGGAAIAYLVTPNLSVYVRLVLLTPMTITMFHIYKFIRVKK